MNRRSDSEGSRSGDGESTTGNDLTALLATPNTYASSLDGVLTAESTGVARRLQRRKQDGIRAVLRDFNLLDDLTKRRTVSGSVFTANSNLLSSLTLKDG